MNQFLHLLNEMSPYLLLGFLIAGVMHAFIPRNFYVRYLSGNNLRSVVYAALFGIPLPLCSCGVIPTAMSLRREGSSRGSVVSFLIATPQTGVDSIIATYGLMGLPFAIIRPVAALVTALFGGGLTAYLTRHDKQDGTTTTHVDDSMPIGLRNKLKDTFRYGYYTMMQDIGRWLVLGLIIATLITVFVPAEWFSAFRGNTLASMLLVLAIAIPMYVCATGSIPVAVALMMKGLTPGAALVFLMAGPASNLASILVVRKVLGIKTLVVYLTSIVVGAIAFGTFIDYLQYNGIVNFMDSLSATPTCCTQPDSWFSQICSAILVLLLVNALIIPHFRTPKNTKTNTMKIVHIEGMTCNHCRMSAEKAILGVKGVTSASVNLQTKEAQIEGDASLDDIKRAIEEEGFTCTL